MIIDRLRLLEIAVHGIADRLRLVRRDAAVIAGEQHRPLCQRHEQRVEHLQLHRHVVAVQLDGVDIGFQLTQQLVVLLVFESRGLEIGRQADMQHVRRLFRRAEGLRIGRAERHQSRLETLPHRGVGVGLLEIHVLERSDALQIRQGRHVHDGKARQAGGRDLHHQHADAVVGVLRLLHGERHEVITGNVDIGGLARIEFARQVAREDRAVHRLVAQFDAHFGAVAIDELGRLLPANQGHVVTRHQELCPQQGAIGGSQDQNIARHASLFRKRARSFPESPSSPKGQRVYRIAGGVTIAGIPRIGRTSHSDRK